MIAALMKMLMNICGALISYISSMFASKNVVKFNNGINVSMGKCIGEGAFSFVYVGKSTETKQNYAVKKVIIQSSTIANDVKAEVQSLQRFLHPNIVELLDCVYTSGDGGSAGGRGGGSSVAYMLFPFAECGTLRTVLTAQLDGTAPRQPVGSVLTDFTAVLDALRCLHEFSGDSYVHFDLKPENVLIFGDGRPVLTDFGSARLAKVYVDSRQKSLRIADEAAEHCTMPYRSPELFDPPIGATLDTRTDVWAVGCLLFAWWYGYSPFECEFAGPPSVSSSGSAGMGGSGQGGIRAGVELRDYEKLSDDDTTVGLTAPATGGGVAAYQQYLQQSYPMKVVPCSHLRILAPPPTRPTREKVRDSSSDVVDGLVSSMIISELTERPFLKDVIAAVQGQISIVNGRGCDV